jgi:hypothetical protein
MGRKLLRRVPTWVPAIAAIVLGWSIVPKLHGWQMLHYAKLLDKLQDATPWFKTGRDTIIYLLWQAGWVVVHGLPGIIAAATFLVPLALLARTLARGRVRAGHADPIDRLRTWTAAHPKLTGTLLALPALAFAWLMRPNMGFPPQLSWDVRFVQIASYAVPLLFATLGVFALSRAALRAFLAPTLAGDEPPASSELANGDIVFNAVAVTRETRAAVGGMAAVTALFSAAFMMIPIAALNRDPRTLMALGAYAVIALGGAAIFRKASRIAVGLDGVLVTGTSKTRFFAYRDVDGARIDRGDVILVRGMRELLRLQLHGEDVTKRDAILERMNAAIARAKEAKEGAPAQIVSSSSADKLARAAQGGADYREPALTRDQLWALVEGPEIDGAARRAAAAALAATGDAQERARLRVAAAQCAEPQIRVAIQTIAGDDDEELSCSPTYSDESHPAKRRARRS